MKKGGGYLQWPPEGSKMSENETISVVDGDLRMDNASDEQMETIVREIERQAELENETLKRQTIEYIKRFGCFPHNGHDRLLRTLAIAIGNDWKSLIEELNMTGKLIYNRINYEYINQSPEAKRFESRLHVGLEIASGSDGMTWKDILGALERLDRKDILQELFSTQHVKNWQELEQSCTCEGVVKKGDDGNIRRTGVPFTKPPISRTIPITTSVPDHPEHQSPAQLEPSQVCGTEVPGSQTTSYSSVDPNAYYSSNPINYGTNHLTEVLQGFANVAHGFQQNLPQGYQSIFDYQQKQQQHQNRWYNYAVGTPTMIYPPFAGQWPRGISKEIPMCFLPPGLQGSFQSIHHPHSSFGSTANSEDLQQSQPSHQVPSNQPNTAPPSVNIPASSENNTTPVVEPSVQRPTVTAPKNNSDLDDSKSKDGFVSEVSNPPRSYIWVFITYSSDARNHGIQLRKYLESKGFKTLTVDDLLKIQKNTLPQNIQKAFKKVNYIIPILSPKYLEEIRSQGNPDNVNMTCVRNLYTLYQSNYFYKGSRNWKVRPLHLPSVAYQTYSELTPCLQQPFLLWDQMDRFIKLLKGNCEKIS